MKTAVLFSGHMRTFKRCLPNQAWFVYRKLADPHFFISCVDDANAASADALTALYPGKVFIEKIKQPVLEEVPFYHCHHAPYAVTPTSEPGVGAVQGFLRLFWHLSRAWDFFGEQAQREEFDVVMWNRGDLHFHKFDLPQNIRAHDAYLPWWGLYGGVNTSGGIFGREAARIYCQTYAAIPSLLAQGCPLHCESVFEAALLAGGVKIHKTLTADFAFMRDSGPHHMIVQPQEMCRYTAELAAQHANDFA